MVFSATFNNISVLSWRSVLLVEETGVPGENHRHVAVTDKVYHIMFYQIHLTMLAFHECPLYQGDRTSLFNCFNNIVPISIEYILFGCSEIGEEFNTLLFKSVLIFIRQTCRFNN